METSLIDYPEQWDAIQLCAVAKTQIWDEMLAVLCPTLDSRRDVIPNVHSDAVFASAAYSLLSRVEKRIDQSFREEPLQWCEVR